MPYRAAFGGTPASNDAASAVLRQLFPRDSCVTCSDTSPSCPECKSNESCQVHVPLVCTECPSAYCAVDDSPTTSPAPSKSESHPKTGAIAGGVVGGVAVIALVTYLVWRFFIKTKRQNMPQHLEDDSPTTREATEAEMSFAARRDQRQSTHTVHSIASTVFTRASNIIQIAYIPGVMNRASPSSPAVLVPPVPPIPITVSSSSNPGSPLGPNDQHFFVPGDLRGSTYSGYSAFTDRTSMARTSYAPRSSIASTIYGKNAVIVQPPQTGMRAKPTMVNLKSPSGLSTPPVPSVDYEKYNDPMERPDSVANSTFSVGSTFLNSASAAMPVRPVVVRVGTGPKKSPLSATQAASSTAESEDTGAGTDAESVPLTPLNEKAMSPTSASGRMSTAGTLIDESPTPDQGPFADPPSPARVPGGQPTSNLSAVIEEATKRVAKKNLADKSDERGRSPFGDEHAARDD